MRREHEEELIGSIMLNRMRRYRDSCLLVHTTVFDKKNDN